MSTPGPHAVPEEHEPAVTSAAPSQAREEETIGEPTGGRAGRRGRVTPRQLWQRMQREVAAGQTREKPPAPMEVMAPPPAPARQEAADEPLENLLDANLTHDVQSETAQVEPTEDRDQKEAEPVAAAAEPAEKPTPKMVEPQKQPGQMRYAYSTHGPAPESAEGGRALTGGEKRVSSTFVLGALIIVVALLIGWALVHQHKKIKRIEERVTRLEEKSVTPRSFR